MGLIKNFSRSRLARFALAGVVNTAVNFAVLNLLVAWLHHDKLLSSIIATSFAIAVSFILNRTFVFVDKAHPAKKLIRFIAVSVVGVLLIQTSVYALCLLLLQNRATMLAAAVLTLTGFKLNANFVGINVGNLIASLAVLFWNYNGYKLFVFNGKRQGNEFIEDVNQESA